MKIKHFVHGKCPRCGDGNVFVNPNWFKFSFGAMHKSCKVCGLRFEKEPGFYWGAMYGSYGMGILEMAAVYGICRLLGAAPFDWIILWTMMGTILLLAPFNFKVSRLIWLYFIP